MMMLRRTSLGLLVAFALAGCGGAGDTAEEGMDAEEQTGGETADPTVAPAGAATGLPAGYELRLDNPSQNAADFHVRDMAGTLHIEAGPRAVLYNPANTATGDFTASATFTEVGAPPNHREAYGIFFGGNDLQGAGLRYTYFVIRPTGEYLIKKRMGEETMETAGGWTASPAVTKAEGGADVTNALRVERRGETVHFFVNDTEVTTMPAADLDVQGVAGVRVNHNLELMVANWSFSGM
jgi:hypothetical protein